MDMRGVCGMVMGVVLRTAHTFSSIHSQARSQDLEKGEAFLKE